jgi:hypothetical protein
VALNGGSGLQFGMSFFVVGGKSTVGINRKIFRKADFSFMVDEKVCFFTLPLNFRFNEEFETWYTLVAELPMTGIGYITPMLIGRDQVNK